MYFKIIALSALVACCQAGFVEQGHGQAVSSQSIVRHDQPNSQHALEHPHPQHASLIQHSIPVLQHSILEHNTPLVQHSFLEHGGSLVQAAPIVHHLAPAVHQSTILQHAAPLASYEHADQAADHASAKYEFSYSVEDPHTGDHKSHHESSDGDVVRGEYSLLQPDGSIRKVEYTADDHNGFNAVVHNSEPNPAAAQPTSAPAHSAPLIQSAQVHSAPFVHSGPVVHSAPIVHAGPLVHAIHAAPTHYFTAHH